MPANQRQRMLIEKDFPSEELTILAQKEGNKKKPIYEMHKWWARRLGVNVRSLIIASSIPSTQSKNVILKKFYDPNMSVDTIIFDPFMGGGTTLIESSKLGARTIGIDIDPVAWFITKKELEYCNPQNLKDVFNHIERDVSKEIKQWYKTKITNGKILDVIYYFWVDIIKCPKCKQRFEGHPHYILSNPIKRNNKIVFCKKCHEIHDVVKEKKRFKCRKCNTYTTINNGTVGEGKFTCPCCNFTKELHSIIKPSKPLTKRLFALEYLNQYGDRKFKKATRYDKLLYLRASNKLAKMKSRLPFPKEQIPTDNRSDNRPLTNGFDYYHKLFNDRQLLCLSILFNRITEIQDSNIQENILLAFSDSLASNNVLCGYAFGYEKLTPLFSIHGYRAISRPVEGNVWGAKIGRGSFIKCVNKLIKAKEYADKPFEFKYDNKSRERLYTLNPLHKDITIDIDEWVRKRISSAVINNNSTNLTSIPSNSVDIILTDPPYYDNIAYSELSDFYYVWLKLALRNRYPFSFNKDSTPIKETIMIRKHTESEHRSYTNDLIEVFKNCRRIIKNKGLMIFSYHHKNNKAWLALGTAIIESGFEVTNVFPIQSEGKSGFHSNSGNIKWDSVFVCRIRTSTIKKKFNYKKIDALVDQNLNKWIVRLSVSDIHLSNAEIDSIKNSIKVFQCSKNFGNTKNLEELIFRVPPKL